MRGSPGLAGVPEGPEVREDLGALMGGMGVPDRGVGCDFALLIPLLPYSPTVPPNGLCEVR